MNKTIQTISQKLCWLVILLVAAILPLMMIAFWHYHLPFGDSWDDTIALYLKQLQHNAQWQDWWRPHNEHRLILTRLLFFINTQFFPQSSAFMQLISYALFVANYALIVQFFKRSTNALTTNSNQSHIAFYALLALMIFPANNIDIWSWEFITQFPLTLFFTLLVLFAIRQNMGWLRLLIIASLTCFATLSSANGLIVWPLSILLLLAYRTPASKILVFSLLAVISIATYTHGNNSQGLILNQPIRSSLYFFAFLGNPIGFLTPHAIPLLFGVTALTLFSTLTLHVFRKSPPDQRYVYYPWLVLGLFTIGNALVAALTRIAFNIGQSLCTRYACITELLYIAIAVLAKLQWPSLSTRFKRILKITLIAFIIGSLAEFLALVSAYNSHRHYSAQGIALPYNIFLPQDNSTYPPGNKAIANRLMAYKDSPAFTLQSPQPNYFKQQLSSSWIQQHGVLLKSVDKLTFTPPLASAHSDLTTANLVGGKLALPPHEQPLSNAILLLNQQQAVVGIAFVALPYWQITQSDAYPAYGFASNNEAVKQVVWLYSRYGIQQQLSSHIDGR
ncbi:MAG: hypothetical protein P1U40_13170 [Coxiellaceae bacterium]|nr:hypothetical protein [Coxiellaceae bacterium]